MHVEHKLNIPVVNQTALTGRYDLELKWNGDSQHPDPEALKQALLDQLGLQLTPDIQPIEMLVVEKVK